MAFWRFAALTLYATLLAVTARLHESWFDEAQAWLMGRDLTAPELWFKYIRYEGTPGLWHTVLLALAKLGLPYGSMHVVSAVAAGTAVALLLWRAPFPAIVTVLVPFTYFLIYQYAVIARSYTLLPLLFVLAAILLPSARRRTYLFTLVLAIMASTATHGTLAAIGILAAYTAYLSRDRRNLTAGEIRRHAIAGMVFVSWLFVLAAQVWPPSDLSFIRMSRQGVTPGRTGPVAASTQVSEALSFRPELGGHGLTSRVIKAAPSLLVLALSLAWFYRNGTILYFALPASAVLMLPLFVYQNRWHSGVVFLIWLFAMWVTAGRSQRPIPSYMWLVWTLVLSAQLYWSAKSIAYDIGNPYSGSRAVAQYLKSEGLQNRVVYGVGYESMSVQPYFSKNVFRNYRNGAGPAFWLWSTSNNFPQVMLSIPPERPDALVLALRTDQQRDAADELLRSLPQSGYFLAGRFDGQLYWKSSVLEPESFLIVRKKNN